MPISFDTPTLSKAQFKALVAQYGNRKLKRMVFPSTCKVCGKEYKGADAICSVDCWRKTR